MSSSIESIRWKLGTEGEGRGRWGRSRSMPFGIVVTLNFPNLTSSVTLPSLFSLQARYVSTLSLCAILINFPLNSRKKRKKERNLEINSLGFPHSSWNERDDINRRKYLGLPLLGDLGLLQISRYLQLQTIS